MAVLLIKRILLTAIRLYEFLLIARAILSWLPLDTGSPIVRFLYVATEPIIAPFRALLYRIRGLQNLPIDFAPLVVFLLLDIIRYLLYLA